MFATTCHSAALLALKKRNIQHNPILAPILTQDTRAAKGLAGACWFTTFLHNGFQRFVFATRLLLLLLFPFSTPTNTTAFQHVEAKMKCKGRGNYFDGVIVELKQKTKRAKILWDTDLSFSSLPCRNLRHHDNSRVTPEMVRIHTRKNFRYKT